MHIKTNLYLTIRTNPELITNNMLKNVTNNKKITQLLTFRGFIIYVDSLSVGEKAYA